jgi:hypothetical protein
LHGSVLSAANQIDLLEARRFFVLRVEERRSAGDGRSDAASAPRFAGRPRRARELGATDEERAFPGFDRFDSA